MFASKDQAADVEDRDAVRFTKVRSSRSAGFEHRPSCWSCSAASVRVQQLNSRGIVGQGIDPLVAKIAKTRIDAAQVNVGTFAQFVVGAARQTPAATLVLIVANVLGVEESAGGAVGVGGNVGTRFDVVRRRSL